MVDVLELQAFCQVGWGKTWGRVSRFACPPKHRFLTSFFCVHAILKDEKRRGLRGYDTTLPSPPENTGYKKT